MTSFGGVPLLTLLPGYLYCRYERLRRFPKIDVHTASERSLPLQPGFQTPKLSVYLPNGRLARLAFGGLPEWRARESSSLRRPADTVSPPCALAQLYIELGYTGAL